MPTLTTFDNYALVQVDRHSNDPNSHLGSAIERRRSEALLRRHFLGTERGRADLQAIWYSLFDWELSGVGTVLSHRELERRFERLFAYVGDSPASGRPLVLFERVESLGPLELENPVGEGTSPEPVVDEDKTTWFEVLVVDEVGEPVPGIEIQFDAGSASGRVPTNGAGVARVDDSDINFATAWVADVSAALDVLEPRWQAGRSGEAPTGTDVFPGALIVPFRRRSFRSERQVTFVLQSPLIEVKAEKLSFQGNHGLMKVNQSDWENSGDPHPSPEWKRSGGDARPVSYTMEETVRAEVELSAIEAKGPALPVELEGTIGKLSLGGDGQVRGADPKVTVEAAKPLPKAIAVIDSAIDWTAQVEGNRYPAGRTPDQKIIVTMDTPIDVPRYHRDAGITEKRLEASARLLSKARTTDPHELVSYVMKKFKYYTLRPSPNVPKKFEHPHYFNSVGGAWPMFDYLREYGECQAICRFAIATTKQVGCPGEADVVMVWAEPDFHNGEKAREGVNHPGLNRYPSKMINGCRSVACLVDSYPVQGDIYDHKAGSSKYIGLNTYEACLRVKHDGVTKYYGGGAGVYDSAEEVLTAFFALAWVSWSDKNGRPHVAEWRDEHGKKKTGPGVRIEKVVKRWRRADGTLL